MKFSLIGLAETHFVPDWLIRIGIRRLLNKRLNATQQEVMAFADSLRSSPLAVETDAANSQHYEVPADFFTRVLGTRLKYSCCWYDPMSNSLAEAEEAMLRLTAERAELEDGMEILELGCGWGSLTLWMAEQFPSSKITAVSNSASQREFILQRAEAAGFHNVTVLTADMRDFQTDQKFDRVVSVEMFEHMRNLELLFQRVAGWLRPEGKAFVHVFCHRSTPYLFETEGEENWMGRHFFTGGMMPSLDLYQQFDEHLAIEQQWQVNGLHYWQTCEHWLNNLDANYAAILRRFQQDLPPHEAKIQVQRWRIFFMACAELFRFRQGEEWFVAHYLFCPTGADCQSHEHLQATIQPASAS